MLKIPQIRLKLEKSLKNTRKKLKKGNLANMVMQQL